LAAFVLGLCSFISECGFGGIRKSAPINHVIALRASASGFFDTAALPMADNLPDESNTAKLQVARAQAIEQYAQLESSLALLFASLLGTTDQTGSIVFFAIVNTRSRNSILASLLEIVHGERYQAHWHGEKGSPGKPGLGGLLTLIRQLDDERNHIVHWHRVSHREIHHGGKSKAEELLLPPHFWYRAADAKPISIQSLEAFIRKADFTVRSVRMFHWLVTMKHPMPENLLYTWPKIFEQPVPYPPSDSHPLSPNYKAPKNPPQSSGV
jgi:hypothetical protein